MKISIALAFATVILSLSSCGTHEAGTSGQAPGSDTTIARKVYTPSGDWAGRIDYTYGPDGLLRHASYEFTTLSGYDRMTEKFAPTKCVRNYRVATDKTLVLTTKRTTDLASGKPVDRTFYEPEISHWMTLAQARKGLEAERSVDKCRQEPP